MNTQRVIFERSSEIPEGLYLELMNKLQLDYHDVNQHKIKVLIINRSFPRTVLMNKNELLENIIKKSIDWEDRTEVLVNIIKMSWNTLRNFCKSRDLPTMKENIKWERQNDIVKTLRELHATEWSQANHL